MNALPALTRHIPTALATLILTAGGIILFNYSKLAALLIFPWAFFVACFALVFATSGRLMRSLTFAAGAVITLHLADRLKIHYYKEPMMAEDLRLVFDGDNWEAISHYPEAIGGSALLLALLAAPLFLFKTAPVRPRAVRVAVVAVALALAAGAAALAQRPAIHDAWLGTLPKGKYVVANLMISATGSRYAPPKFPGNPADFARRIAAEKFPVERPVRPPDIVVLLQESTVNPMLFNLVPNDFPALKMFPGPGDKAARMSLLRVHTYGGATWRTEFDVLTGLACTDFGAHTNSVFYTVTPHLRNSLPAYLRTQGYQTVVLSPFDKGAYHAGSAYADMGFDRFVQPQDLGYPAPKGTNLWHIASADIVGHMLQLLREKTDKPLFVYALTMNEHGPYPADTTPAYRLTESEAGPKLAGKFTDYFNRLPPLDEATLRLRRELEKRGEPFILAYFGDHQPGVGLPGERYHSDLPSPEFITQVVFASNLPGLPATPRLMASNLVPGYLVEAAGLPPDEFFKANIAARRLFDGKLEDHEDKAAVDAYRAHLHESLGAATK